jgi:predicted SAM-dependent methyltransferase
VFSDLLSVPGMYLRSRASLAYAAKRNGPGVAFAQLGKLLARRMIARGDFRVGLTYLLTPVNIVRYFEFPFTLSCLPERLGDCLDVASPRLFSLFVARNHPTASIRIINPDSRDLYRTVRAARSLRLSNITTECWAVERLNRTARQYESIWAISVVEHIAGETADTDAMSILYNALKPGGRLIVTVPVDRKFWLEYRQIDHYGTQGSARDGQLFFQRHYDGAAVLQRLVEPLGVRAKVIRWFGEKTPGRFAGHDRRWQTQGFRATADDAREIVDNYGDFADWSLMPGQGVCGLMIEKD